MKNLLLKRFVLPLSLPVVASFFACSDGNDVAKGPGSITTNGIVAYLGDVPVAHAKVALRQVDYIAAEAGEEMFAVADPDAVTDSLGRFALDVPEVGQFRLTVAHDGVAFTQVVSRESYSLLDSVGEVRLQATATVTGVADVPEGSKSIWVGVLGTDVLVRSDSNGVFVIPAMPANDSLQLYFMNEAFDEELLRKSIYVAPYEQALINYKTPVEVDSADVDTVAPPADTVAHPKVVALLPDGTPASYATVALRSSDAMTENYFVRNSMVKADLHADENGRFDLDWPAEGRFRLTVTSGSRSYSKIYDALDLPAIDTLTLAPSVSITSNVSLRSGEEFAWVGVYGLDELVKTDGVGSYVLPALPAMDSLVVYFVYNNDKESFMDLELVTSQKSEVRKTSVLLYDFEQPNEDWYMSVDTLWKGSTYYTLSGKVDSDHLVEDHLVLDSARGSNVFYAKYRIAFDPYAWVLLGTALHETLNLGGLDSIELYAKGNGAIRLTLENWDNNDNVNKAASKWMPLDSVWNRYVFTPADLCINGAEKLDCETSWDVVKGQVKQIHIFPSGGSEFFIDDVKLYGALF